MVDLSITIATNNNRELLDRCLHSIYENTRDISFEIIVVDNCTSDGSIDMVREKYPDVRMILNSEPDGFSANHNRALREINGRYVVLLNDDTEVLYGCFDTMHRFLLEHPGVGCLGCRVLNPDGSLQQSVYRMPGLSVLFFHAFFLSYLFPGNTYIAGYKKWPHDKESEVSFIIGACMMFPRAVIENIGLMDERFFIYAEDADVCKRVIDSGHKVMFIPSAEMIHHGGATMKQIGDRALQHSYRSMHLFFEKHYGKASLPFVAALNLAGALNRIVLWNILRILNPGKRDHYNERLGHFRRVADCYLRRRYRKIP